MEEAEIRKRMNSISGFSNLLAVMNMLKKERFGDRMYEITRQSLMFCANINNDERYTKFLIKKKSGGVREICAPRPCLKDVQYYINQILKRKYTPSPAANGFTEGRSIVTGAQVHIGHNYVFNIDLSNFFPSISKSRVWKRLTLPPFNFDTEVAELIARICCIKETVENENGEQETRYVLPQGAPTSPLLTNAVCDVMDHHLIKLAHHYGLHYTRYADDMTFSSMHNVYQNNSEFIASLKQEIAHQGFTMNEKKTRLQKRGSRQEVTGITVNDKVNVAHKFTRELRNLLYIWKTYGYDEAFASFYAYYKADKGHIKKGEPIMDNVVEGKLNYIRMVKGEDDAVYQKLRKMYDELQPATYIDRGTEGENINHVFSLPKKEFEQKFNAEVELRATEKGGVIGYCNVTFANGNRQVNREIWVRVSKKLQAKIMANTSGLKSKDVIAYPAADSLWMNLCRHTGKNFWLLTETELRRDEVCTNKLIDAGQLIAVWEKMGLEFTVGLYNKLLYETSKKVIDKTIAEILQPEEQPADTVSLSNVPEDLLINISEI